jgi:hypothetical protein
VSGPTPQPNDSPDTLRYRHLRAMAGLVGMALAFVIFVLIQLARNAHDAALLARGCPPPSAVPLPNSVLQLVYVFAIPIGMPLALFLYSAMLFSPSVFGQLRTLLPWGKAP